MQEGGVEVGEAGDVGVEEVEFVREGERFLAFWK